MSVTFTSKVAFKHGSRSEKRLCPAVETPAVPTGRVPRVARLMALAIHIEELVRGGVITDYADAARLGHVTRARMSQIMSLLQLAPGIQEAILHLNLVTRGRDPIDEHDVRPIAAELDWGRQREMWRDGLNKSR